jgi:enterochelin esterase family protein
MGSQAEPGTDGDGTIDYAGPYSEPAEGSGDFQGQLVGEDGTLRFASNLYSGHEFPYWIYVPTAYDPETPAALMVFQDGVCYINCDVGFFHVPQVFDSLIAEGAMPVTIALFINPPRVIGADNHVDADRAAAYDSLSAKYSSFLVDEIIPGVILSAYNIVEDPDGWAIGGHSSGGISAFTAGWNRPDKFHKILTHNGSFVDIAIGKSGEDIGGWSYPDLIKAEPTAKPLRTYLLSGPGDIDNEFGSWLEGNDRVAAALAEKGYHYRYMRGTSAEGTQHWPPLQASSDLPGALRWLWRGYTIP